MRQSKWVLGGVIVVCLWLLGSVGRVQGAEPEPFAAAHLERFPRAIPLPEVSLPDPEGKRVSLQSFKGQVVLMNFWTTW
jgi:hypothetical protein